MGKITLISWIVLVLLCHTACQKYEMDLNQSNVESENEAREQNVQNLIQQARTGETDAYKNLASCYLNGEGVEKSTVNSMYMYSVYCRKIGIGNGHVTDLLDEGHPYRLLNSPDFDESVESKLVQMAPAEAKCMGAMKRLCIDNNDIDALELLKEAEEEGSELAGLFQIYYYMELKADTINYQQCLFRLANKFPFLNTKIAELYKHKYDENGDFSNIQSAIEYYYKADVYGMLSPGGAEQLWGIYDQFKGEGMLDYEVDEIERIKSLVKTNRVE